MPNLRTHCAISKKRTGYGFEGLHKWIDEPAKEYGMNHRIKRHYLNDKDLKNIKKFWDRKKGKGWGQKAVIEWLFHIALDNMDTAFKFSKQEWSYGNRAFNHMEFGLANNGFIHCDFNYKDDNELHALFEDNENDEGFIKGIIKSFPK